MRYGVTSRSGSFPRGSPCHPPCGSCFRARLSALAPLAARRGVTVVLCVQGPDGLYAGYHNYREPGRVEGTPEIPHHYIGAKHIWVGDEVDAFVRGGRGCAADTTAPIHREARAAGF